MLKSISMQWQGMSSRDILVSIMHKCCVIILAGKWLCHGVQSSRLHDTATKTVTWRFLLFLYGTHVQAKI